jgi:hypothetical protein
VDDERVKQQLASNTPVESQDPHKHSTEKLRSKGREKLVDRWMKEAGRSKRGIEHQLIEIRVNKGRGRQGVGRKEGAEKSQKDRS